MELSDNSKSLLSEPPPEQTCEEVEEVLTKLDDEKKIKTM